MIKLFYITLFFIFTVDLFSDKLIIQTSYFSSSILLQQDDFKESTFLSGNLYRNNNIEYDLTFSKKIYAKKYVGVKPAFNLTLYKDNYLNDKYSIDYLVGIDFNRLQTRFSLFSVFDTKRVWQFFKYNYNNNLSKNSTLHFVVFFLNPLFPENKVIYGSNLKYNFSFSFVNLIDIENQFISYYSTGKPLFSENWFHLGGYPYFTGYKQNYLVIDKILYDKLSFGYRLPPLGTMLRVNWEYGFVYNCQQISNYKQYYNISAELSIKIDFLEIVLGTGYNLSDNPRIFFMFSTGSS